MTRYSAVASESRHDAFVTEVLAPGFKLFRRSANALTEQCKRITELVWAEVWQPGPFESLLEDSSYRVRAFPVFAIDTDGIEQAIATQTDFRSWKQRVAGAKQLFRFEELDPVNDELLDAVTNRKERRPECLTILRANFAGILEDHTFLDVDMLQRHRGDCIVSGSAEQGERNQRPVPPLDVRLGRH